MATHVTIICPVCTEEVYEDQYERHAAKDHEEAGYYKELGLLERISAENGLGIDKIMSLAETAYL